MKKFLFLIISLFPAVSAFAQTGVWSGNLEVMGTKLPLVFHLDDDKPTVDSPNQGAKGIPIQINRSENGEITITVPMIGAVYNGKLENNEIVGTFRQNGMSFPLKLNQGEVKPNRPQTPQPPFPYTEEEVSFSNGDAVLKGTLTLPPNYNQDTPVLLMVTGSGLQNRDEEIFDHKPFAVIADALVKSGIATLRYDDRGFGESTGDPVNCTTEDLMKDALAGIDLLRSRFKKVGVLGHSEGGTIALMLAADGKTDFIVSLAGMAVSGKETLMKQNQLAFREAGYSQETVEEYCEYLLPVFDNDASALDRIAVSNLPEALKQNLQVVAQQVNTPYMQYFLTLDMRPRLKDIVFPVLALNGTKDTQVFYQENLDALENGLNPDTSHRLLALEGLNHLFQHANTGSITEYATIEETFAPEALTEIINWIRSL